MFATVIYHLNTLCWQASDHTDIFINQRIECYLNNAITLRPLTPHYAMLYPQNGDRIVAIDSVTSPPCIQLYWENSKNNE